MEKTEAGLKGLCIREIMTKYTDRDWIWSFGSNLEMQISLLEIAIIIGIQDFTFGDRDRIWKWRPNLEIVILLREIGGHCMKITKHNLEMHALQFHFRFRVQ